MDDDSQKSNKSIILVVVFIIVVIFLFTTNIKSFVNSSKFKNNITYIQQKADMVWNDYILKYIKYNFNNLVSNKLNSIDNTSIGKIINVNELTKNIVNGN